MRILLRADRADTSVYGVLATLLLFLRIINYLAGAEMTAKYVQMTLAVTTDMSSFLLILVIFLIGNIFVMQLLYPPAMQDELQLDVATRMQLNGTLLDPWSAVFGSVDMLFAGAGAFHTELLDKAYLPPPT